MPAGRPADQQGPESLLLGIAGDVAGDGGWETASQKGIGSPRPGLLQQ